MALATARNYVSTKKTAKCQARRVPGVPPPRNGAKTYLNSVLWVKDRIRLVKHEDGP